ncbi:MAG: L,D-transpeptidase [Myxococcales bacterium]|nr:L,D-transpeptidase [Myxococcales bacterium]
MSARRSLAFIVSASALTALTALAGCSSSEADTGGMPVVDEGALVTKADEHWFYGGPMPTLDAPSVTASMKGHTARVSGLLPRGARIPDLPHVRTRAEGDRVRVDVVYPIATARPGKSNSRAGKYDFYEAKPYRPDGPAYTRAEGWHDVPWGGFPFIAYNSGIAFHGPITSTESGGAPDLRTWYLQRGAVSGGCNRMLGEHVVELAHILGIRMTKVYAANTGIEPTTRAKVDVIDDYDTYDGKLIDVDYPTDSGATRPAVASGSADNVTMFGSWIASELPDGQDLPPSMKWAGGVRGAWYVFAEHAQRDWVCSAPKADLPALKRWASAQPKGELPPSFCKQKECVLGALRAGKSPQERCEL